MTWSTVLFYVLAALTVASAILMVVQKNPVASALWLVLCFIGMAGLFVIMEAFFIAVVQVLVYAGAIMVLFLFVIMLLGIAILPNTKFRHQWERNRNRLLFSIVLAGFPVYHCNKKDSSGNDTCPPGQRCVDSAGKASI